MMINYTAVIMTAIICASVIILYCLSKGEKK